MKVESLDHINIRTRDVAATVAFFREILDMEATPPPGKTGIEEAAWLIDSRNLPVIHVSSTSSRFKVDDTFPYEGGDHTGPIHHVALRCDDYGEVLERLARSGRQYTENHVEAIHLRQLFVMDTNGILLELNFHAG